MNARAGTVVVHVPYRGIADATKDLLSGEIQSMTASIPATLPLVADKRVKVLAVTGAKRIPQLPGVPSWQEEGVPNANVINYWGIVAPAERRRRSSRASTPTCRRCWRNPTCASGSNAKAPNSFRVRRIVWAC